MNTNILEWLEASAKRLPGKEAFADEKRTITFQETCVGAKICGTYFAGIINSREPVVFYLEKSCYAVMGMFGAVYAGGFYSLIDTRQPAERVSRILDVLKPKVIVTDEQFHTQAEEIFAGYNLIRIEEILENNTADEQLLDDIRKQASPEDPVYVNFTSGSTGTPKGVTICHRSIIDFIIPFTEIFGIRETDIMGNQAPFDFDVSVKDIFSGILTGAKVQIIPRSYFSNPTVLMDYLCDNEVTVLVWAVSAMCFVSIMNGFGYRVPETVRLIMFSGEVMPIKQYGIWKKNLPHARFVNLYGPTEITCNCTYYELEDRLYAADEAIPIGKPFPHEKVFLLDENDHLITEPGISGEICVAGDCLALGYYNDPVRTAEVFVQNPLTEQKEIIYRTGDLAEYREDGNLVYRSRKDFQIKHLGHRIELGEIETQVQAMPGAERACAIYDFTRKRIFLFYTGAANHKELQEKLKEKLPPFMIPNKMIQVAEMPMTKNGKIDRNRLKEIGGIR
ncbi:MAG TPA: D-alanine--poly(phosphoribitol) ligase [Erysipelotrichaceae bacterium]|nr:D-alanine--poly(phosphoribitol) ligase [Erysipelotrichaceae bacterium]